MTNPKPAAEFAIDRELIRTLLREYVPSLADESIELVATGWDNEIYRLGPKHVLRIPRRKLAAQLISNEQQWLPELERRLPLPVPTPVHEGHPAFGFPWPWSIVKWLPGVPLLHAPALDQDQLIADLSGFLNALHVPAPEEAPENRFRGVPLAEREESVRRHIDLLVDQDRDALIALWEELVHTPPWGADPIWLHGDMHPANLLVRGGKLSAVIDFGDLTSGDPATDLSIAWMLFDADGRDEFRSALEIDGHGVDIHTWNRARANALAHGAAVLAHSADEPSMRRMADATLRQVMS
ncbi:MAG: aminoglycoside phosphotransferase family protein [Acidimicrobiales bacterium]